MRSRSLAAQWGRDAIGSADCSRDERVEDEEGEGGFSAGKACSAFASSVGLGGLGTLRLRVVGNCPGCDVDGVEEEGGEVVGYADWGQEKGVGGENAA